MTIARHGVLDHPVSLFDLRRRLSLHELFMPGIRRQTISLAQRSSPLGGDFTQLWQKHQPPPTVLRCKKASLKPPKDGLQCKHTVWKRTYTS